jgi:Zn-dependent protease with chaperone function
MNHEATILNDTLNKGRKSGKIKVLDKEIEFYDEENLMLSLPVSGLKIAHGGTGNRYIFFTHDEYPGWTISTDDKKVLDYPAIKKDDSRKKTVSKIKWNRRILKISALSLLGLVVGTLLLFYIFRGAIVESVAHQVPVTWEQDISETMLESALVGKNVVTDSNLIAQLDKITQPLVNSVENKDFKFTFTIIEDETLNAYALPGGAIVIHSGLIEKANHVNEVAGVLAHEISHVTRRHHIRGMVDKVGFFVLLSAFLGDAAGIGTELALIGSNLEALRYSRDYELEADESGWELMLKANLNPSGMIAFFETLEHEHGGMPDVASFMSTHPATTERIEKLKAKANSKKDYTEIDIDFESFKTDLATYFTVN